MRSLAVAPSAAAAGAAAAPRRHCRVPAKATAAIPPSLRRKADRRLASFRAPAASPPSPSPSDGEGRGVSTLVEERPSVSEATREEERSTSSREATSSSTTSSSKSKASKGFFGLGDLLGPIGLTIGGSTKKQDEASSKTGSGPIELGPIGMTVGASSDGPALAKVSREQDVATPSTSTSTEGDAAPRRLGSLTTEEWRARYEPDGCVDLWVEEEFNAGSRVVGGRAAYLKGPRAAGAGSGEGRVLDEERTTPAVVRTVRICNKATAQEVEVSVPEDRYVLWEAEDQGLILPYACRMGCCTACAVRVKEGEMSQPEALGVAAELRERGFALMCVGFAKSDLVLELAEEDEVYDLQFGDVFESRATDPKNLESVERDPFALEIANMDE